MAGTLGSGGTMSCTTEKEWFDESSSEDDCDRISNCHQVRLRKMAYMAKCGRAPRSVKTVEPKVDVRVTVKIDFVPEATLTAHVGVSFKNGSSNLKLSKALKKKGKKSVENWRDRPVRARVRAHRHFQRTLPGELERTIILGRRVLSASAVGHAEGVGVGPNVTAADGADVNPGHRVHEQKSSPRETTRLARKTIVETEGLHEVGFLRDHPSLSFASHVQVAKVIAKCLPLRSVDPFLSKFESFVPPPLQKQGKRKRKKKKGVVASPTPPCKMPPTQSSCDEKICKTPVEWVDGALKHAFGEEYVMLKRCEHPDEMYSCRESHSDLDIMVVDCVLARDSRVIMKRHNGKGEDVASDAPVQACRIEDVDAVNLAIALRDGNAFNGVPSGKKCTDEFYRACLVIVPQAGVFYCHRERRSLLTGVLNSHVPMDINWLRLKRDSSNNCFGEGSYVSRIANAGKCSIWKWSIRRSRTNMLPFDNAVMGVTPRSQLRSIHFTVQLTDDEGPALPPDCVVGKENELLNADLESRKETFRDAFSRSTSAKRGCRHYVPGFLHKGGAIDPSVTFVIDPCKYGELDLQVDATIPSNNEGELAFHRISVVQIRYLPSVVGSGCDELLADINEHCNMVRRHRGNTGARAGNGDLGAMHPIGSNITKTGENVPYVTSMSGEAVPVLWRAVRAVSKLASLCVPAVLRVIQDLENDSGMKPVPGMDGGVCRVTHSMDLSINLANSSHYDSNDGSHGLSIWTEEYPGTTEDWYFILPNMRGKFPGTDREYNGIAIKLSHGVLIGWDGRVIRHGTSMVGSRLGNIYGTFFAGKSRIVKHGMSQLAKV